MKQIILLAIMSYACIAEGMEQQQQQQSPDQGMVRLQFFNDTTDSRIADLPLYEASLWNYFPQQDKLARTGENGNIIRVPVAPELTPGIELLSKTFKVNRYGNLELPHLNLQQLSTLVNTTMDLQADHLANTLVKGYFVPHIDVNFDNYIKGANSDIFTALGSLNEASRLMVLELLRDKNNGNLNHKTPISQALQRPDLEYQKIAAFKVPVPSSYPQITFAKNDDSSILFSTKILIEALKITPENTVLSQGIIAKEPDSTITHFSGNRNGNTLAYAARNADRITHLHILQKIENTYQEQQVLEIGQGRNEIVALAFHPTQNTLLLGLENKILVLEKQQSGQYRTTQTIENDFSALAWHSGKADTFAAGGDAISVFTKTDIRSPHYQLKQRIPPRHVHNLVFSKNPDSIIGLQDQFVAFMNADDQGNYNRTGGIDVNGLGRGSKPSIAIHPNQASFILGSGNKILAYGVNYDKAYKIFELPTRGEVMNSSVAFSPTGKYFAAITSEGDGLVGEYHATHDALDALKKYSTLPQAVLIAGAYRYNQINITNYPELVPIYESLDEGPLKGKGIQQMLAPLLYYQKQQKRTAQE